MMTKDFANSTKHSTIGHINIDFEGFSHWYISEAFEWLNNKWSNLFYYKKNDAELKDAYEFFSQGCSYSESQIEEMRRSFDRCSKHYLDYMRDRIEYSSKFNQRLRITDETDVC